MKKKIIWSLMAVVAVAAIYNYSNTKNDLVALNNIEVLAFASGEGVSTGNTGPGKVVDCGGPATGTKKLCMSTNPYPCTETTCE